MEGIIYEYLILNCTGYKNRVKANVLMEKFKINDNKIFRGYIQTIRQHPDFTKMIGSEAGKNGGYWIIETAEEFYTTVNHLLARAEEMRKVSESLQEKFKDEKGRGF